ncbi:ANTAR domain-containing protein [Streptomyces sp. NPDC096012]|uniref:ANTAR domain-containing protein n=1 Tax=Streptomyces sp. NPDC096012 TaxID=3155684 RepID=UPI00336A3881
MTTFALSERRSPGADLETAVQEADRLRAENAQLQQAISSHAAVDQAIGVLVALARISPDDGFCILREVSQHLNIKLSALATEIIRHARGAGLPPRLVGELHAALSHHAKAC